MGKNFIHSAVISSAIIALASSMSLAQTAEIADWAGFRKPIDRCRVAAAMLEALWKIDSQLLTDKAEILNRYRKDCVTVGQEISLVRGEEIRRGKAIDIDADGALVVEFASGRNETVNSGEVSIRGMYGYV